MFPVTVALPQVRAGHVRAYAITAEARRRRAGYSDRDEAGLPGFHISLWWGFWMPKGTPKDIIARLNAAVVETLADPATQKRIADQGLDIPAARPADAGRARRLSEGRDREVVADHQGGQHQGPIGPT